MIEQTAIAQVLDIFVPLIREHLARGPVAPFTLAVSGLQGSGKSTWAAALTNTLIHTHGIHTRTVSLDDFYHTHETLVALKAANADNPLLATRGQPGTHDEVLARDFFTSLADLSSQEPILLPAFDKSRFDGEGERVPRAQWEAVPRQPPLEVIIFEGWCIGFQPLSDRELESKVLAAKERNSKSSDFETNPAMTTTTLKSHTVEHLKIINNKLREYCASFTGEQHIDGLLHLTTDALQNVYRWRISQEHTMKAARGSGMSDEEVIKFVHGYMPGYELYLDKLTRQYFFTLGSLKPHVQVVLDESRTVRRVEQLAPS